MSTSIASVGGELIVTNITKPVCDKNFKYDVRISKRINGNFQSNNE